MTEEKMNELAKRISKNIRNCEKDIDKMMMYADRMEEVENEMRKKEIQAYKSYLSYCKHANVLR